MIDEILEQGQVLDRQVFELYSTAPRADLFREVFRDFSIIYNSALNLVQVNETAIVAEYFYYGAPLIILVCRHILGAQPDYADILDLPHVHKLIGSYKSSACPFFALEPLVFSFFLKHFLPPPGQVRRKSHSLTVLLLVNVC